MGRSTVIRPPYKILKFGTKLTGPQFIFTNLDEKQRKVKKQQKVFAPIIIVTNQHCSRLWLGSVSIYSSAT